MPTDDAAEREPDYRFTLANERTFLAWTRTSLALVAVQGLRSYLRGNKAQALEDLGRLKKATKARGYLRGLQALCGAKASVRGSIRYNAKTAGDRILSTSQAVPALARVELGDVSRAGSVRGLPRLAC